MGTPTHLDGTALEGGGQLLRIAIGLSSLSRTPVHITNIRGKRSGGGGLRSQHLKSIQWLSQVSSATLSGAELKSKEITYSPTPKSKTNKENTNVFGEKYKISQNTPGSINLIFQAILPYILFGGWTKQVRIWITGGTNVPSSPSYDYVSQVLLPMLSVIGVGPITVKLHSRGWSQGRESMGGATFYIDPLPIPYTLPCFSLVDRGAIIHVRATVFAPSSDIELKFVKELSIVLRQRQEDIFGDSGADWNFDCGDSRDDKRFYLLLVATTSNQYKLGRDWLYDQRLTSGNIDTVVSKMVGKVVGDLVAEIEHGACVDEYMRDQLVVFQALAKGNSQVFGGRKKDGTLVKPSLHARTAQWVAKKIVGVEFNEEGGCEGLGFQVPG